jgi:Helix-turn-helix.
MIAKNIKKLRKIKGLTQEALARKARVSYTTLTKLESGVIKKPSVQVSAKIAKALGTTIERLIK